jgi:hypothetical protein
VAAWRDFPTVTVGVHQPRDRSATPASVLTRASCATRRQPCFARTAGRLWLPRGPGERRGVACARGEMRDGALAAVNDPRWCLRDLARNGDTTPRASIGT